ncbi:MAG: pyrroline-5-carboxylate reductase [Erysipelotrichaceae bacterium]
MDKKIGFIGCGNMGGAMISGICAAKLVANENIFVSDMNEVALKALKDKYGVNTSTDNTLVASSVDYLVLSVKPNLYAKVISEIRESVSDVTTIVAIGAGQTIEIIQKLFGKNVKVVRCMPNTPAMVLEGMAAICPSGEVSKNQVDDVVKIFESFGKAEIVKENLMDAVTAVSGSSPAYVFMMIEAMADAAVLDGMPRAQAYTFAAQAVMGSAKMVLETHKHPGELKDMVCSPSGTTIEAVKVLEETGFRSSIIKAMNACSNKSKAMK